jgi:hypothetical protein
MNAAFVENLSNSNLTIEHILACSTQISDSNAEFVERAPEQNICLKLMLRLTGIQDPSSVWFAEKDLN